MRGEGAQPKGWSILSVPLNRGEGQSCHWGKNSFIVKHKLLVSCKCKGEVHFFFPQHFIGSFNLPQISTSWSYTTSVQRHKLWPLVIMRKADMGYVLCIVHSGDQSPQRSQIIIWSERFAFKNYFFYMIKKKNKNRVWRHTICKTPSNLWSSGSLQSLAWELPVHGKESFSDPRRTGEHGSSVALSGQEQFASAPEHWLLSWVIPASLTQGTPATAGPVWKRCGCPGHLPVMFLCSPWGLLWGRGAIKQSHFRCRCRTTPFNPAPVCWTLIGPWCRVASCFPVYLVVVFPWIAFWWSGNHPRSREPVLITFSQCKE